MAAVHETMEALHKVGAIDKQTMRHFDDACLTPVLELSPKQIKAVREREPDGLHAVPQRDAEPREQVGAGRKEAFRAGAEAFVSCREARHRRGGVMSCSGWGAECLNRGGSLLRTHT